MQHTLKTSLLSILALSLLTLPAQAQSSVSYQELLVDNGGDLEPDHWAATAMQELIDKYGIMAGYPDKTFKGTRTLSRNEMAAALYQVLKYVDQAVAGTSDGKYVEYATPIKPEEFQKLAALSREFKQELDQLKNQQFSLNQRVSELEKVTISGEVQLRYRDRIAVTDGTDINSPLFVAGNVSDKKQVNPDLQVVDRPVTDNHLLINNNAGMFTRDQTGLPTRFNSPAESNITFDDIAPFRIKTALNVEYRATEHLKLKTGLDLFEVSSNAFGANNFGLGNGGHDLNEGLPNGMPFVFREAVLDYVTPGTPHHYQLGLTNFKSILKTGSQFKSLFDSGIWNGRDYGLVGFGASEVAIFNPNISGYRNSLSRYWQGGLNISMVDPDSHDYNQVTAPSISYDTSWSWGRFMVGINAGSIQTNRLLAADSRGNLSTGAAAVRGSDANFSTSALYDGAILQGLDRKATGQGDARRVANHLALPSTYGDGYAVTGVEGRFFEQTIPLRIQLAAMSYLNDNLLDWNSATRKEISATFDLGWQQNFGASLQLNKSFMGFDRHSLGLFFNNLNGTGIDLQAGATLATRGLLNIADTATGSAGLAVNIPLWGRQTPDRNDLSLLVALRQSFGDQFGGAGIDNVANQAFKDSGITVSVPFRQIAGSNLSITAQYSALFADALWQFRPVAHDVSVLSRYQF